MKRATPIGMTEEGERTMENRCEEMREQVKQLEKEYALIVRKAIEDMTNYGGERDELPEIYEKVRQWDLEL